MIPWPWAINFSGTDHWPRLLSYHSYRLTPLHLANFDNFPPVAPQYTYNPPSMFQVHFLIFFKFIDFIATPLTALKLCFGFYRFMLTGAWFCLIVCPFAIGGCGWFLIITSGLLRGDWTRSAGIDSFLLSCRRWVGSVGRIDFAIFIRGGIGSNPRVFYSRCRFISEEHWFSRVRREARLPGILTDCSHPPDCWCRVWDRERPFEYCLYLLVPVRIRLGVS